MLVVELESVLLVLNGSPDHAPKQEISEAEKGLVEEASVFVLEIFVVKAYSKENHSKGDDDLLVEVDVGSMEPVMPFTLVKFDFICGFKIGWSVHEHHVLCLGELGKLRNESLLQVDLGVNLIVHILLLFGENEKLLHIVIFDASDFVLR